MTCLNCKSNLQLGDLSPIGGSYELYVVFDFHGFMDTLHYQNGAKVGALECQRPTLGACFCTL